MTKTIDHEKLSGAARALERAACAAHLATRNFYLPPCEAQMEAAKAEIECAKRLLAEAVK